jgi:hypothetical protein
MNKEITLKKINNFFNKTTSVAEEQKNKKPYYIIN